MALADNFQEFLSKPLLIGAVALFPILKFYLAFNPIFYGTINILIDNKPVYLSSFSDKNLNFISKLLETLNHGMN